MITIKFKGNQYRSPHTYVTDSFEIAVLLQSREAKYKPGCGGQPHEREYSPTPTTCMAQGEQRKRRVRPCNMQIDSSVVEFAKQFLQLPRTTAVIPRWTDVRRQHTHQIDNDTRHCPLRLGVSRSLFQQKISCHNPEQDTCPMTKRIRPFFSVTVSFVLQCFLFLICWVAKILLFSVTNDFPYSFFTFASFISGIPSEMDIKSAIGFFQCLWRVNNFLLCGYLVYDCLPEQASMPLTDLCPALP